MSFHDLWDKSSYENNNQTVNNDEDGSDSLIPTKETMKQTSETVKEPKYFSHCD